jgi:hypothetical protein
MALEAYGIELPSANQELPELFDAKEFLRTTVVVSWTALALSPKRTWFEPQGLSA